jgi:hypothetical protein
VDSTKPVVDPNQLYSAVQSVTSRKLQMRSNIISCKRSNTTSFLALSEWKIEHNIEYPFPHLSLCSEEVVREKKLRLVFHITENIRLSKI